MHGVQGETQSGPDTAYRVSITVRILQAEYTNDGKIQSVQHIAGRAKVIEFLRQEGVSNVKHGAQRPAQQANVTESEIVGAERVAFGDGASNTIHAVLVSGEIQDGEESREHLLAAKDPMERPFSVELNNRIFKRRVFAYALEGNDALACVVAFRRTCPGQ